MWTTGLRKARWRPALVLTGGADRGWDNLAIQLDEAGVSPGLWARPMNGAVVVMSTLSTEMRREL